MDNKLHVIFEIYKKKNNSDIYCIYISYIKHLLYLFFDSSEKNYTIKLTQYYYLIVYKKVKHFLK